MSKLKPRGKPFARGHGDLRTPKGKACAIAALRSLSDDAEMRRRANISKGLKGRPMSEKTRRALRDAKIGRPQSEEHISRRFSSRAGYKHSSDTKAKIGRANSRETHKTDESKRARTSTQYKTWREAVYRRDDYTCKKCGKKGGYLHPHHVVNFAEAPELRYTVENGITFCVADHRLFHRTYGSKNNTSEQVAEFVK